MTNSIDRRAIFAWAAYDWANSAFSTIITTFIFAAYFTRGIAPDSINGTKLWGYAIAIAGIIIVILSPIFGAIADHGGRRKPWLALFTLCTIIGSALLWFAKPMPAYIHLTLLCVIIGTIGLEISQVFYNALLPNVAPYNYLGRISGWGWGAGYTGGLVALAIALFGFVQAEPLWLDTHTAEQVRICGPLVAIWIAVFALPLFRWVPDYPDKNVAIGNAVRSGLKELFQTIKTLPQQKNIFTFLIARMIYTDGLNTVFAFGGIYAAGTFGMAISDVIKLGIVLNISAGIGAIMFAWIDDYIGAKPTILFALMALVILGTGIVFTQSVHWFWILTAALSLFFGPVQAASRSLMARIVPKEKITEMFGIYALSGKATAFIGPWLLAIITAHFNSQRAGIASVLLFFVIGGTLLIRVKQS